MEKDVEESCAWKDTAQCEDCVNQGVLHCRWKAADLFLFLTVLMPEFLGPLAGTVLIWVTQGVWWPFVGYLFFIPIFLGLAETRFLCSHCPYYAQKGHVLHCLANHGVPKVWRYHPGPMNRPEKWLMYAFVILLLVLVPGAILGYNIWFFAQNYAEYGNAALIAVISLTALIFVSLIAGGTVMYRYICRTCVNFSCPFNGVDKAHVDAYLIKNPVMCKAWEEKGYRLGDSIKEHNG